MKLKKFQNQNHQNLIPSIILNPIHHQNRHRNKNWEGKKQEKDTIDIPKIMAMMNMAMGENIIEVIQMSDLTRF